MCMKIRLTNAIQELEKFYDIKSKSNNEKEISLAKDYLAWVQQKTNMIINEKKFSIPDGTHIKRGDVYWIEFGFNIDEEFGGRHPGIVLRRGGNTAIVLPLSTQDPTNDQKKSGIYVEIKKVWGFKNMTRWVNVLNSTPISIQRFDFASNKGNVKGPDLDAINEAIEKSGLWGVKKKNFLKSNS